RFDLSSNPPRLRQSIRWFGRITRGDPDRPQQIYSAVETRLTCNDSDCTFGFDAKGVVSRVDTDANPHRAVVAQTVCCNAVGIEFTGDGRAPLSFHWPYQGPNLTIKRHTSKSDASVVSGIRKSYRAILDSEPIYRKVIGPQSNCQVRRPHT